MSLSGYEIVWDSVYTSGGDAAKVAMAPSGKVVTGGGFRFVYDTSGPGSLVRKSEPNGGIYGTGNGWLVQVEAGAAGTLHTFAVCVDA